MKSNLRQSDANVIDIRSGGTLQPGKW